MFELLHNKFSPTRTETIVLPQKKLPDMLNPNDWAFLIYIFVVGLVVLIFHSNLPDWPWYIAAQASIVVITLMIIRFFHQSSINVLQMLRHWYPIFSFTFLYMQAGLLNQLVFQGYVDDFFLRIDLWIFGVNPNIWLYDRVNNFYFNEFIHLCYFSYYILPAAFGVILYITKDKEFYRTLFGISITFYFCYFLYILIPAAGPVDQRVGRFEDGGLFVPVMNWIYSEVEKPGAAFPSSHVAIALITLMYAYRLHRRVFWVFLPFIVGLIFSTFYGFYHYVIDSIAGAAIAVGSYYLCNSLFDKYAKAKFPDHFP
ncbi:phosphatase PAP2 family protein [bacterium]|nr:phosphatase PAP2 family protein [bacterium]